MAANNKDKRLKLWVCFVAYLLFLSYLLFFSRYFGRTEREADDYRYNLTLFQEIGRYWGVGIRTGSWRLFLINVIGNVAVFVPIGLALPQLFRWCKKMPITVVICFLLSLLAEVTQLLTCVGSFDVDDLLLNTIGGGLGWLIAKLVWKNRK